MAETELPALQGTQPEQKSPAKRQRICYGTRAQRTILRLLFGSPRIRAAKDDWESVARFMVGAFRADGARVGAGATVEATRLGEELSLSSPDFARLWRDNDVVAHGEGLKRIHHAELGLLELEFSAFAIDGRPELGIVIEIRQMLILPSRYACE